ncbi:MAG: cupin domain-containing protein [Bryobacteraceae bacterium]
MPHTALLRQAITGYWNDPDRVADAGLVVAGGLGGLPILVELLREDAPIERTERLEALYKQVLRALLTRPISGPDARQVARYQRQLGFVLKYKSYAIKAATPLGYSIFLQSPGQGFSFQHHLVHKLEVFHILAVQPGGFVFLCDYQEWQQVYERRAFENWLGGAPNPAYERFKFVPDPGDVFVISELGVVHTVVGCVLEEYATVSTDMVRRLHDQNEGRLIPASFTRANAERALRAIEPPPRNRLVRGFGSHEIEPIDPVAIPGGEQVLLCDSFVKAACYRIRPRSETALACEATRAVMLRLASGHGSVVLADSDELGDAAPGVEFERGDLILIPPGIHYAVRNESAEECAFSEQCIAPEVALV